MGSPDGSRRAVVLAENKNPLGWPVWAARPSKLARLCNVRAAVSTTGIGSLRLLFPEGGLDREELHGVSERKGIHLERLIGLVCEMQTRFMAKKIYQCGASSAQFMT